MELILLGIYAAIVWLIFIKFKLLPWNITSQVIVVTIPIVALSVLMLCLNIGAPTTKDMRAINYVVQIVPRVTGRVIEVPVEPNRPVKKGDVLFKIDPTPFELEVKTLEARVPEIRAKLKLAELRAKQSRELSDSGAGPQFDTEQWEAESAQAESMLVQLEAQLAQAKWKLDETVVVAPSDGTVLNLQLRPGSTASQFAGMPVMSFVENEQWVIATFKQNELHQVQPGNLAEISTKMYPGRIIKCKVDSIIWATAEGQMPLGGTLPSSTVANPRFAGAVAVKLKPDAKDADVFLAAGARGSCAIYTDTFKPIHILRMVLMRVHAKFDWIVVKHIPSGHH